MRHLKQADYIHSDWSGGSTTQIAIAPAGAVYAARDFLWRVSSAGVELAESDFTPLPDYDRYISVLAGEMTLTHGSGAPVHLRPFAVYAFDGGTPTHSVGKCTDFNLMLRKGACSGTLRALRLAAGETREFLPAGELVLYCCSGTLCASDSKETLTLACGESICTDEPITLCAETDANLMLAAVEKII